MRAIASLFGLALFGICPLAFGQRPLLIAEAASQPNYSATADGVSGMPQYSVSECDVWQANDFGPGYPCTEWWCQSWYLRTEVVFLQRSKGYSDQVIVESAADLPLLSTGDFSFNYEPGVSVLLGHRLDSISAWELQYFGAQQWDATQQLGSASNLNLPDPIGMIADDFNNADAIAARYRSNLHNAELNYLRDHAGISWLIGFRYLNWEESFQLSATDDDGDNSNYGVGTSNNLLGAQIGARASRQGMRWDWELSGKAGVFGNDVVQRQLLVDDDSTLVIRNTTSHGSGASFVGDMNLSVHCRLNDVWRLRGGYNVMWITDLALSPDQLDFSNTPQSGTAIDRSGEIFLQGFNVGLEAMW